MPLLQYRASTLKTNEVIREYIVKVLLSPFSLLYGLGVSIRNLLYQKGVLRPARFDIPIISVGNLSIGGTGKSPQRIYARSHFEQGV